MQPKRLLHFLCWLLYFVTQCLPGPQVIFCKTVVGPNLHCYVELCLPRLPGSTKTNAKSCMRFLVANFSKLSRCLVKLLSSTSNSYRLLETPLVTGLQLDLRAEGHNLLRLAVQPVFSLPQHPLTCLYFTTLSMRTLQTQF